MNRSTEGFTLDKKASEGDSGFCGPSSFKSASLGSNFNSWSLGEPQPDSRESSFNSMDENYHVLNCLIFSIKRCWFVAAEPFQWQFEQLAETFYEACCNFNGIS
jgi:hypothetical protein